MRPPECALCDQDALEGDGGLVSFARDPQDAGWYQRAAAPGFVGHPPHEEWFCSRHRAQAAALSGLTLRDAMRRLRQAGG